MIHSQTSLQRQKIQEILARLKGALQEHPKKEEHFRDIYKNKPITLLRTFYPKILWPKKLRYIFAQIWLGKAGKKVIIIGPRGGGKSVLMASLGFTLWYLKKYSIVDMGGALAQAKIVYSHFSNIVYSIKAALQFCKKEPLMENTESIEGNYFKALPASPKAVRGPHPDVLMADEVCEAKDEIVADALPMVTSSPNPLTILTSTFHKIFGAFQEIWDMADELGYTRFSWDIFDVTLSFNPTIWNDPELNKLIPDLKDLKKLAKGRTGDPQGWVLIENIIDAWQGKRSIDWFLIEFMGNRPNTAGLINDPIDVEAAIFDNLTEKRYNYIKGAECIGGIDWGFSSMTSNVVFMNHLDAVKVQVANKNYTQVASEIIIDDACELIKKYDIKKYYCDNAGKFENEALKREIKKRRLGCIIIEVIFSVDKEEMLGNYRAHFQRKKIKIPKSCKEAKWQHKRYKYIPGTNKPVKKDDHIPDATMCALKHWPLGKLPNHFKDLPKDDKEVLPTIASGMLDKKF